MKDLSTFLVGIFLGLLSGLAISGIIHTMSSPVTGNITVDNGGAHTQTALLSGDDEARLLRAANRMLADGDTLAAEALKSVAFVKFYTFVHEDTTK